MSLNKWKAWPVENSKIELKIDKKLVTTKRGSWDQFLAKIKFSYPNRAGDERIQKKFWSILISGTSKSEFVFENYDQFQNWPRIRGQNGNNTRKSWSQHQGSDGNDEENTWTRL